MSISAVRSTNLSVDKIIEFEFQFVEYDFTVVLNEKIYFQLLLDTSLSTIAINHLVYAVSSCVEQTTDDPFNYNTFKYNYSEYFYCSAAWERLCRTS